jgi:hypothetical protein
VNFSFWLEALCPSRTNENKDFKKFVKEIYKPWAMENSECALPGAPMQKRLPKLAAVNRC